MNSALKKDIKQEDYFGTPTLKEIKDLFKGKPVFKGKNKVIKIIFKMVSEPSLMGLDYSDINLVIQKADSYLTIFCYLKELSKYQNKIDSAFGSIVSITIGENGTLGHVNSILEGYFSKQNMLVPLAWVSKKIQDDNPKIEVLLAFKK